MYTKIMYFVVYILKYTTIMYIYKIDVVLKAKINLCVFRIDNNNMDTCDNIVTACISPESIYSIFILGSRSVDGLFSRRDVYDVSIT